MFILLSRTFPPDVGGVQSHIYGLIKGLSEVTHKKNIIIISRTAEKDPKVLSKTKKRLEKNIGKVIYLANPIRWLGNFNLAMLLYKELKLVTSNRKKAKRNRKGKEKKDNALVILCANWIPSGIIATFFKEILKMPVKVFVVAHGTEILNPFYSRLSDLWIVGFLRNWVFMNADAILANSSFTAKLIKKYHPKAKVHVVNPACESSLFNVKAQTIRNTEKQVKKTIQQRHNLELNPNNVVILTVAAMESHKNHMRIIKAVEQVRKENQEIVYIIVGPDRNDGSCQKVAEYIKKKDLENFVIQRGRVSKEELVYWYKRADVFVLPSLGTEKHYEGFGVIYAEAAMCKVPSIAGKIGGASDIVVDGKTGFLVDATKTKETGKALSTLVNNKALRNKMGKAAYKNVKENFNYSKSASQILELSRM